MGCCAASRLVEPGELVDPRKQRRRQCGPRLKRTQISQHTLIWLGPSDLRQVTMIGENNQHDGLVTRWSSLSFTAPRLSGGGNHTRRAKSKSFRHVDRPERCIPHGRKARRQMKRLSLLLILVALELGGCYVGTRGGCGACDRRGEHHGYAGGRRGGCGISCAP